MTKPAFFPTRGVAELNHRRRLIALGMLCGLIALSAVWLLRAPPLPDLSLSGPSSAEMLSARWATGDIIAVVRHLERCDRTDAPCLHGDPGGITERSVPIGEALAQEFAQLGLGNADLYHSPLGRTTQTAQILFGEHSTAQDWLYACRKAGTLLHDALAHKRPGHNLVLVTHSTCKDKFENDLGFESPTPPFGTTWFVTGSAGEDSPQVLGFLDVEDWDLVFPDHPAMPSGSG